MFLVRGPCRDQGTTFKTIGPAGTIGTTRLCLKAKLDHYRVFCNDSVRAVQITARSLPRHQPQKKTRNLATLRSTRAMAHS